MLELILDVETKKTFDEVGGYFPDKLGISFVGACLRENGNKKGELLSFFENDLNKLFPLIERADVVIGFNIDGFDMPTLSAYYQADIRKIPTLDLMARIKDSVGHRIGLDAVAQETLGSGKIGDGLDAIRYFHNGNLEALKKYCLEDVKVTRDIYDYGLKNGLVKFRNKWNRLIKAPVDFTFVAKRASGTQMSLI
jgi:DEAD/DEAH box helicase domain-containing protein